MLHLGPTSAGARSRIAALEPDLSRHIPVLDGVRGLAILGVCVFHMTVMEPVSRADRVWVQICSFGWTGVDLFFVLSGFLITGILLEAKGREHYFRNFYARRVLRIFPLYYCVVAVSLLVLPHIQHAKAEHFARIRGSEVWYWTYLCNFSIARVHAFRHGILDVCWSLAIEEQFYLVWPAVVLLSSRRGLLVVCCGCILMSVAVRAALALNGAHPIALYVLTPCRMDGLAAGALVAILARGPRGTLALLGPAKKWAWVCGLLAAAVACREGGDILSWRRPQLIFAFTVLAGLFAAFLLISITGAPRSFLHRFLSSHAMRTLGKYSYAIYLFHLPLRALIRDTLYKPEHFLRLFGSRLPGQMIFYVLSIGIALLAARVSWIALEQPFLSLKRFFPNARASRPGKASADGAALTGARETMLAHPQSPHGDSVC